MNIGIIPARMAATRFPDKPLFKIKGIPMIGHVYFRTKMCPLLDEVYVATCDQEIASYIKSVGGKVIMTSHRHERCTDRIAEAASQLTADIVVNVQGDEPLILPEMLEAAVKPLREDETLSCVNLVVKIKSDEEFNSVNVPKVVVNLADEIIYISREAIPSFRKTQLKNYRRLKQLGIIAFRKNFLIEFARLEPTPNEIVESVDMMRAIDHGFHVKAVEVLGEMIGVDAPEDVRSVEERLVNDQLYARYKNNSLRAVKS